MERWLSWSKAHDWKSCVDLNSTGGSNPPLSARKRHPIGCLFCFIRNWLHRGVDSFFIKVQQNGFGFFATSIQIPATLIEKSEMEGGVICQDQEDRGSDRAVPWEWDFADRLRLRRAEWSGHIGADVCRGVCSMFWGQPESLPLCWQSCCDRETGASLP